MAAILTDAEQSNSLADLCLATPYLISYAGFLHFNELVQIKDQEIHMSDSHITTSIEKARWTNFEIVRRL